MPRKPISTRERIRLFQLHGGVCHICSLRIMPGQDWDVSHDTPLALGGADDDGNRLLAHRKCHRESTRTTDVPSIAKAKRREAKHLGAAVSRNPLPFGRKSWLRKKLNGQVVRRV